MWKNTYKDYRPDEAWVKEKLEAGRGMVGCEMHETNGWGDQHHTPRPKKRGFLSTLFHALLRRS